MVATPAELTAAIDGASPGDEIVLADGTYRLTGASCDTPGTATAPILVRAANRQAALVEFDGVEGFKVTAAHWHFEDLDVRGVCADDNDCEHAFHVSGAADGFVLRGSRVRDFNAQLKVNAAMVGGTMTAPDAGLVEANEIGDTRGRDTGNPTTKLNIDTGDDWIVRGNYLHDASKLGGDGVSYAMFLKSGGKRGLVERNLVVCQKDVVNASTRIGISLGGGGTAPQFCAPAFDAGVPCAVEHDGGTIRNNIIASCSDVGIYLNRAKDTKVLYNTLVATAGIDFRFVTTSGEAAGNYLGGRIRDRDGATHTSDANLEMVADATFTGMYRAPLAGDLVVTGDISPLVGMGPERADVIDDFCAQLRPGGAFTLGAIEHSGSGCETLRPPIDPDPIDPGPGDFLPPGDDTAVSPSGGGCCDSGAGAPGSIVLGLALVALVSARRPAARSRRSGRGAAARPAPRR